MEPPHTIARLHGPQRIANPLRGRESGTLSDYVMCVAERVKQEPEIVKATTFWARGAYANKLAWHRVNGLLMMNGILSHYSQGDGLLLGGHTDMERNLDGFLGFVTAMNEHLGGKWVMDYTMMPDYHRLRVARMRATGTSSGK